MSGHTFTSAHAVRFLAELERHIVSHEPQTSKQLAAKLYVSLATIERYTHQLWLDGCIRKAGCLNGAALWESGCDPMALDYEDALLMPHRQIVRQWTPNHFRNWFDCAMFGTPALLQGVI